MAYELVVVGVSAGGLHALCTLVHALPLEFALPLVIVQHRSKDSDALCDVLQQCTPRPVQEIVDKEPIREGRVYLAPPDYHVLVERGFFSLSVDEPVRFSRPSIDVTLESASDAYGPGVIGMVLTGANRDGAWGLHEIARRGGAALVQDPADAEVAVMPRAALAAVPHAQVAPIASMAERLTALVGLAGGTGAGVRG